MNKGHFYMKGKQNDYIQQKILKYFLLNTKIVRQHLMVRKKPRLPEREI